MITSTSLHVHVQALYPCLIKIIKGIHCKNKQVVSTTEWLHVPWLQTNWRDSGYERFALVLETNCI